MQRPHRVALIGAESTGKSALAAGLAASLGANGHTTRVVPEFLREWCDRAGRTPRPEEQAAIAREQARRSLLPVPAALVLADTTPLMTAVYSDHLFGDTSLYPFALAHQRRYHLTLLTGLDLPWTADGQRDGPHAREPVDTLLRAALSAAGLPFVIVYGQGPARVAHALQAIGASNSLFLRADNDHLTLGNGQKQSEFPRQAWSCDTCSDPGCEHRLFSRLLQA